jgi:hypothetical protein
MSDLADVTFVDEDEVDGRYRVLLYGQAKAGKSVGAATAPGPIMVLSADRPGAYRFARTRHPRGHIREVRVEGKNSLDLAYTYLRRNPGDFQTVVVDPVGNVYDVLLKELGGGKPQIQHHGMVQNTILDFVKALRALPIHVVLVAHEEMSGSGDDDVAAVRRPMTGGQKLPDKVMAEMDIIAHVGRIPATEESPDRWVGVLVEDRGRVAGDATGALGKVRDLDLSEWFSHATASLSPDESDLPWSDDPNLWGTGDGPLSDEELAAQEQLEVDK